MTDKLFVKSHVARDLMQSAGLFRTDKLVVWEYVSNSLQYVDAGVNPFVRVRIDSRAKTIAVTDNGRGMDWEGLQNFFVMHGENLDRKRGQAGRGRFGTGKSAAFGIANILRVSTTHGGKRSIVELRRKDIEKMNSEDPIPVKIIEREASVNQPNGTTIEIAEINLRTIDTAGIIAYIEKHLARWAKGVRVTVNNHECEYHEPPIHERRTFPADGEAREILGDVTLVLKIAKAPLEEDLRGVSIFSNGVWHETTLAGNEGREMSQYIFGEIDVPRLDTDDAPIAAFDVSRSMRLNPENPIVKAIHAFVGRKIDAVRRELVAADKNRRAAEEARKLSKQAAEIARVINEDFNAFRQRINKARQKIAENGDAGEDLIFGASVPANIIAETGGLGSSGEGERAGGDEPRHLNPQVEEDETGEKQARRIAETDKARRSSSGFGVEFKNMGAESYRAVYDRERRTIYINLEHPQMVAALSGASIEDPLFRRLSYEIAFSEYSIALASELEQRNEFIDLSDPIVSIRETLNRVARMAASLYETK